MVVYLLHEYVEDLHSVLAVYASVDKAVASCKGIALQHGLTQQSDDTSIAIDYNMIGSTSTNPIIVEYCNSNYDAVVWVESMEVVE